MTWEDLPGWFDFPELYDSIVKHARPEAVFAEVGCWAGRSVAYLAHRVKAADKGITVWAIDHGFGTVSGVETDLHRPLLEANGGNIAGRLASNLQACGVFDVVAPLVAPSVRAASLFPDSYFDFVFIDAAHDKDNVTADLNAWWPKVRTGGVLAGHDYDRHWPGVVQAVNEFFGREVPDLDCPHCWSVTK